MNQLNFRKTKSKSNIDYSINVDKNTFGNRWKKIYGQSLVIFGTALGN